MNTVLIEVQMERCRQDTLWGIQNRKPEDWLSVLGEEFGEVCHAVCEGDEANYRKELVQLAAVAVSMVECFDRNRKWSM